MRLVVHLGAAKAGAGPLQKRLFLNQDLLASAGVYLPKAGRLDASYETIAHHNLGWELLADRSFRPSSGTWSDLEAELGDAKAETVLLSSESFGRIAASPWRRTAFAARLRRLADEVVLLYVAREPLAQVNEMFVQTVTAFGEPFSFDDYVSLALKSGYFDLDESLSFWYDSDSARLLALAYDDLVAAGPLAPVLSALGITVSPDDLAVPDEIDEPFPGATAVEAMRALNAHLRVVDGTFSRSSSATARLAEVAQRRAVKLGWYDDDYWGWTPKLAPWAAGKLAESEQAFAQAVWGTDWPMTSPVDKPQQAVNVIDADRKTFNDVMTYVANLTLRYMKFRGDPGEAAPDDVLDVTTMVAGEAERAARVPVRRPATKAAAHT